MRLMIVVGALTMAVGTASAAWDVELEGGDRMTVDSYWQDGDKMHLMRDGVDLSVPNGRVKSVRRAAGASPASQPAAHEAHAPAPKTQATQAKQAPDRETLEAQQAAIDKHLLRVQQERFEADARGDDPRKLRRLTKEFRRTQDRRRDTQRALGQLDAAR